MEIFIFIAVANKSLLILDIFARMNVKFDPLVMLLVFMSLLMRILES
ncbi:MAG: hypothetical protein ACTTIV_03340 [Campylobacter sp.]